MVFDKDKDFDKAFLPSKMGNDAKSRAGTRAKPTIEEKMAIEEGEEGSHDGYEKARKMITFIGQNYQKMRQALEDSKKAKYQPEAKFKKDYQASMTELEKLNKDLDKIVVQRLM